MIDLAVTGDISMIRSSMSTDTISGIRDGRLGPNGETSGNSGSAKPAGPRGDDNPKSGSGGGPEDVEPWALTASELRDGDEENSRFTCPPQGSGSHVWGTSVYTDDSSVCTAAVHMGLFTFGKGRRRSD